MKGGIDNGSITAAEEPMETDFERIAAEQAAQKPFPKMTARTAISSSVFLAMAMVLPALGFAIYAFESSRIVLGFTTTGIILAVGCGYYLILYGIVKRRRQM